MSTLSASDIDNCKKAVARCWPRHKLGVAFDKLGLDIAKIPFCTLIVEGLARKSTTKVPTTMEKVVDNKVRRRHVQGKMSAVSAGLCCLQSDDISSPLVHALVSKGYC